MPQLGSIELGDSVDFVSSNYERNNTTSTYICTGAIAVYSDYYGNHLVLNPPITLISPSSFPITVLPGALFPIFTCRITPVAAGSFYYSVRMMATAGGTSRIGVVIEITGEAVTPPTKSLSIQPLSVLYPDTEINTDSQPRTISITNNGVSSTLPADAVISALTPASHYELIDPPTLPYTLPVGETLNLSLRFSPTSAGDKTEAYALTITSDVPQSPQYVAAVGYCFLIAVNALSGLDIDTLFAFAYGSGPTATVKLANSDDLNCEEIQQLNKLFDFGTPFEDKTITDIYFMYENLGITSLAATVNRRVISADVNYATEVSLVLGSNEADKKALYAGTHDYRADGNILEVALYKGASSGPISISEYLVQFLSGEKLKGGFTYPLLNPTSHIVDNLKTKSTFFFSSDEGVILTKYADADDLDCEEEAWLERLSVYELEGYEKAILRVWLKIEDKGESTMTITPSSPHGTNTPTNLTFGDEGVIDDILNIAYDICISGEMVKLKFSRAASSGAISILSYIPKIEQRGEVKE
jgi:hypothetical protein